LIENNEKSPVKFIDDVDDYNYESKSNCKKQSSKSHLKSFFGSNKFSKSNIGVKQVISSHIKKLDFGSSDENTPVPSTPQPQKLLKKSYSDISGYNKHTIKEVSRRLQDDIRKNSQLLTTLYSK
jgi:hypothetical protein